MEMNFCRRCGEKLTQKVSHFWKCINNHSTFLTATPTAGVFFVTDKNEVILARRGIEPGKGMLDSFGGFIDGEESAEQAISREIEEEIGLTPDDYDPLKMYCSAPSIYHYENENKLVLSTFFWSRLKPNAKPIARDDVAEIVILPINQVNTDDFYGQDVKDGFETLKNIREES